MIPQTNPATSGIGHQSAPANALEDDGEAFLDLDLHSDSDDELPTKVDVARFLGHPKESGPIGFAKQVGEMMFDEAMEWYALPPEHLEELFKTVSSKLAQIPWPRKVPAMPWAMGNDKLTTC